jgi:hypothetical protein
LWCPSFDKPGPGRLLRPFVGADVRPSVVGGLDAVRDPFGTALLEALVANIRPL